MKKLNYILIAIIFLLAIFVSCDGALEFKQEGENINELIYPYLKFDVDENGKVCSAVVIEGAAVEHLTIPGSVETENGSVKVNKFLGFENPKDAENLKHVVFESSDTKIAEGALSNAPKLESVDIKNGNWFDRWGKLPTLEKEGFEFLGWMAGDEFIEEGMAVNPDYPNAIPVWRAHTYIEHEGKEPTCTSIGWKPYVSCKTCDYSTYEEIPALGHSIVHHDAVDATCTDSGIREHYSCSRCNLLFSDEDGKYVIDSAVVPAIGHVMIHKEAVEATCTKVGYHEFWKCEVCDKFFSDAEGKTEITDTSSLIIPMIPHSWETKWSSDGETHWHECSVCHAKTDESSHTWGEPEVIVNPTKETAGKAKYTCTVCGYEKEVILLPSDHNFEVLKRVDPTCTEDGYIIWFCKDDGCGMTYTEILKAHHSPVEVPYRDSTCTSTGVIRHFHCSVCGKCFEDKDCTKEISKESTIIAMKPHTWKSVYESDANYHWHVCSVCGQKSELIPHNYEDMVLAGLVNLKSSATCTEPAVFYKACVCGHYHKDPNDTKITFTTPDYPALGHKLKHHEATEKPCAKDGHIEYYECERCGLLFADSNASTKITNIRGEHTPRFVSSDDGHQLICAVCNESVGPYHVHETADLKYDHSADKHWKICKTCKHVFKETEECHDFKYLENGGRVCTVCQYSENEGEFTPPGEGGMGAELEDKSPKGKLIVNRTGNDVTVRFEDISEKGNEVSYIRWRIDDVIVDQFTNKDCLTLTLTEKRTYNVNCMFKNKNSASSLSVALWGYQEIEEI